MMKKNLKIVSMALAVGILLCGCTSQPGNTPSTTSAVQTSSAAAIALTEEEAGILEMMGEDVQKVSPDEYVDVISAISSDPDAYTGQVYQFEGTYVTQTVHDESTPYVINMAQVDGTEVPVGLALRYLTKEIPENTEIRVTAIIGEDTHDGHAHVVLEVVAIESV